MQPPWGCSQAVRASGGGGSLTGKTSLQKQQLRTRIVRLCLYLCMTTRVKSELIVTKRETAGAKVLGVTLTDLVALGPSLFRRWDRVVDQNAFAVRDPQR